LALAAARPASAAEPAPAAPPADKPAAPGAPAPGTVPTPSATPATAEKPITLPEAIDIAMRNHANIEIASQGIVSARQRVTEAKTGTLPSITGVVAYSGRGVFDVGGIFGPGNNVVVTDNGVIPTIGARQTLYDNNQTRLQVRQARAGLTTAEAGLSDARRILAFIVTSDYIQLLRSGKQYVLRDDQVNLAQQQLDLIDGRIAAGAAAASDRFPLLRELRLAQQARIGAQNDVNVSASALRNSMGLPLGPPLQVAELPEAIFDVPSLQASLTEAMHARPDLLQAQAAVTSSQAALSLAQVRRGPVLSSSIGFNVTPKNVNSRSDWNFLAGVAMPIWDAGLTRAQERDAAAALEANRARLEQTQKDIEAEVQQAHLNVASARERVDASASAVEAARVALEAANARYQQGLAITVDLTDAQIGFITARNDQINAIYDYFLARAQLARAVGNQP
jgi:outer membrane protein